MPARPKKAAKIKRERVIELAQAEWDVSGPGGPLPSHFILAIRPYWSVTIGKPGNDLNAWDDLFAFVTPDRMRTQAGNTDPTRYGWNAGVGKPMASLNFGCWPFRRGPHKGKTPALRQFTQAEARKAGVPKDGRFSVTRTYAKGDPRNYTEAGYYAINQHPGGWNTTSSEGCLTTPPDKAGEFLGDVWETTKKAKVNVIWTILIEGPVT
jgi:lysozyme